MMKNRRISKIAMVLTATALLLSLAVSTLFGTSSAEYFKSLSQKISFKATPDLAMEYYIKNGSNTSGTRGVYVNTKNIKQEYKTSDYPSSDIYQIKMPITQEGFYTLSFTVDFWLGDTANNNEIYIKNFDAPVGCQVLHPSHLAFASGMPLSMAPDDETAGNYNYGVRLEYDTKNLLDAYNHYQWKTLAPARAENVELTFSVETADVNAGYVNWCWEFTGLAASTQYTINLNNIELTKNTVDESSPYFEFMKTQYINNAICPDTAATTGNDVNLHGVTTSGYTRYNRARGTYVTNATYDSLTMQVNPLFECWSNTTYTTSSSYRGAFLVGSDGESHSNMVVFNVPMKNIKKDTNYRVSFDFSVAKQGNVDQYGHDLPLHGYEYSNIKDIGFSHGALDADDVNYSKTYNEMFNSVTGGKNATFQSYLHDGAVSNRTTSYLSGADGRQQITLQDKYYPAHEVTRYDEIMKVAASEKNDPTCAYTTANANLTDSHATVLNSGLTESYKAGVGKDGGGDGINWLNAIRHTEINGENRIKWLTFYNTCFTFNIPSSEADVTVGSDGYCNNLFWTWAIDALEQTAWFRIKIENIRIEEVVQYGSFFDTKGLTIGSTQATDFYPNGVKTYVPEAGKEFNATFRHANGTGQNYQARGYGGLNWAATNIFGAVYDAGDWKISGENDWKIKLSGYCAAKGGIEKYVWSADNGKTWHDTSGGTVIDVPDPATGKTNYVSTYCEKFIDQGRVGITDATGTYVGDDYDTYGYSVNEKNLKGDYIDFVRGVDNVNGRFDGLVIDLSEYRYQQNLDIIVAAVPFANLNLRCEMLRIINFNAMPNYRTYTTEIESDITVGINGTCLSARDDAGGSYGGRPAENTTSFLRISGLNYDNARDNEVGGYARRLDNFTSYKNLRAIYQDVPIETTLKIRGWAIVEGGVEGYYWSADYGKTWNSCEGEPADAGVVATDIGSQKDSWYDGDSALGDTSNNCAFDVDGITAELSSYVGQTVDVIFAAKSNVIDAYCPVARIDNVAVYGNGSTDNSNDRGTFFTRLRSIYLGNTNAASRITEATQKFPDGKYLTYLDRWNLGYESDFSTGEGTSYTIFEPYNVDLLQARKFVKTPLSIANGGTLYLDGYVYCPGGVAQYKYSLNGGKDWTPIDSDNVTDGDATTLAEARRSDASFGQSEDDGKNGNFMSNSSNYLAVTLPNNLAQGTVKDLLVVAVANKDEDEYEDKLYPVLHQTINISGGDEILHSEEVSLPNVTLTTSIMNLNSTSYTLNYSAIPEIPITKGTYTYNGSSTKYGGSSMSVPKTYFLEDESIPVTYSTIGSSEEAPWIAISNLGDTSKRNYSPYYYVTNNASNEVLNISGLEAGEYMIWLLANDCGWPDRYNNLMTEPISIKVVDPSSDIGDFSLTHVSDTARTISIGTTVFKQGVDTTISFTATRTSNEWVAILGSDWTEYRDGYWKSADNNNVVSLSIADLPSGQYRLFYLSGSNISAAFASGTVYAIIDIIILPSDASQTLTVEYTNSEGIATTETPKFDVGEFNVTEDLNVQAGTTVKITAEYKNFGAITGVNRFKFSFEPKS